MAFNFDTSRSPPTSPFAVSFKTPREKRSVIIPTARDIVQNLSLAEELIEELPYIPSKLQPKLKAKIPRSPSLSEVNNIAQYLIDIEKTKDAEEILKLTQRFLSELNQELVDSLTIYEKTIKDLLSKLLEVKELRIKNESWEIENSNFKLRTEQCRRDIMSIRHDMESILQERSLLKTRVMNVVGDHDKLLKLLEQARSKREELTLQYNQANNELILVQRKSDVYIDDHKQLEQERADLSRHIADMNKKIQELKERLEEANAQIKRLEGLVDEIKRQLQALLNENEQLRRENLTLNDNLTETQKRLRDTNNQLEAAQLENKNKVNLNAQLEKRLRELQSEVIAKEEQNKILYQRLVESGLLEERKTLIDVKLHGDLKKLRELLGILGHLYSKPVPTSPGHITLCNFIADEAERYNRILNPDHK
eukprot:TRINITY_DN10473_c0_g1_i1.p1 TRINITY_DN10473_c0_g1~~TRINITY_DN10473_c0_g1_i1.p1  ORF type:complete len:423 (-),score=136.24 TRINITY_DN10473_c0_g1_i1:139-1407(-)